MSEYFPARRLATLLLITSVGSAGLAGCTAKSPGQHGDHAVPSTAAPVPRCGTLSGANAQYGEHFGIDPNQLPTLLSNDTNLWDAVKDDTTTTIRNEHPPAGLRFVVSAEVGYASPEFKAQAERDANTLAHLASEHLGYPIGGGSNDAYPALQNNIAMLHVCASSD